MLYPTISAEGEGQAYRLQEIARLRKSLEDERDKRASLYKKYQRAMNVADAVDTTLLVATVGLGVGGIGLLSTVVAAPVVLGLEIGALACGLLSGACKLTSRRLLLKTKKHELIRGLAVSKLGTVATIVSKALVDGKLDDVEFNLVIKTVENFHEMKRDIRSKTADLQLASEAKKALILQGREEARAEFAKTLSAVVAK